MLPSDSIPVRAKSLDPTPLTLTTDSTTLPTDFPEQNGKAHVPGAPFQTHHCQTHRRRNLIRRMTPIQLNQIKRNAKRRKIVEKTRNRTRQAHCRAILIRPMTVITDTRDVRRRATGKRIQ